jgi:cell division protease FtsH
MTYGRFLEYLEMGWVKQVDLYDNSRNAIVQASSPDLEIDLSQSSGNTYGCFKLIQKLKEYNINFDASSSTKSIFITIASNLLPVIFWRFNFLFQIRRIFHGGGQSPMNLGKSPARFDERPDTGFHSTISLVLMKRKLNSKKLFHF